MTHYQVTRRLLKETIEAFGAWVPKAMERLEAGFEDAHEPLNSATPTLPEAAADGQRSRAAKARQIRRRERVIRIFPNEESALRQFLGGGSRLKAVVQTSRICVSTRRNTSKQMYQTNFSSLAKRDRSVC